ncbi:hypothetical protein B0H13DRAFT_1982961 [Mycena leptocephala]|nr:hypothetical protein B0H13DRAFT_1982961 [Mycena leptocephala]
MARLIRAVNLRNGMSLLSMLGTLNAIASRPSLQREVGDISKTLLYLLFVIWHLGTIDEFPESGGIGRPIGDASANRSEPGRRPSVRIKIQDDLATLYDCNDCLVQVRHRWDL